MIRFPHGTFPLWESTELWEFNHRFRAELVETAFLQQANVTNLNNGTFHYVASQMAQGAADVFMLQETHNDRYQNLMWRKRFEKLHLQAFF